MLKVLKEAMDKELKETRRTLSQQIENTTKDTNYRNKLNRNTEVEKCIAERKKFTLGCQQKI